MANRLPIALIGYGRMGHILHDLAADNGCEVVTIIDPYHEDGHKAINRQAVGDARVCIDFSQPDAAPGNIRAVCELGLPMVVGTTGWQRHLAEVGEMVSTHGVGLVHGANFSVGMNAFYAIVDAAAELMNGLPGYDPFGLELHHNGKADSPSGTAHTLSQILLARLERKTAARFDRVQDGIEPNELHFASVRAGAVPGTHIVGFDSPADTIELKHTARNRTGFAVGALLAARWVAERKGLFDFRDIFFEVIR
ncbi:MAG: 4-hydroxy-tetrahydrodipicolinate reductase [Candidatus Cloacimonetes bacterium]|nr:4-hydroxy-tetrahydrodipicolinate reductase [Candidatus Cloacimonadota bacterium]